MSEWISVKDKLPDADGLFLCTVIRPTGSGEYRRALEFVKWNVFDGCSMWDCNGIVTHWMEKVEFPEDIGL